MILISIQVPTSARLQHCFMYLPVYLASGLSDPHHATAWRAAGHVRLLLVRITRFRDLLFTVLGFG